ncbi:MAG: exonuclease subunit SbcD [Acidimicrobiaceae bacterium]|nr:exonuclease subunit SbcD [Acidimicrobiaceae bacterium]MYC42642.1 exonuclease subunit SbcD [Acidimicrobiaceae bacterium]MYH88248.1 exonuclease subunit SbcD [Acidimicrobiaceae bacterium]
MKLLHTSDWHVGKTIRGHSRADEHEAVFDEIVSLAGEHSVDLVIVAGDLFETASPSAQAESLVYRTLLRLLDTGAHVAVISGNHDNARRLHAVAPVFEALGRIHLVTEPSRPDDGGLISLSMPKGEEVRLAMLPFVSQRGVVRAKDLMEAAAYENTQAYADRVRLLVETLTAGFGTDTINILAAHAFVYGGQLGGGERAAHFIDDYAISA